MPDMTPQQERTLYAARSAFEGTSLSRLPLALRVPYQQCLQTRHRDYTRALRAGMTLAAYRLLQRHCRAL